MEAPTDPFVTFESAGRMSVGIVRDSLIIDLGAYMRFGPEGLRELLRDERINEARAVVADRTGTIAVNQVRLLPPVPQPEKILCIGVNYGDRNAEYRDQSERPKWPSLFMRTRESVVGHGQPILRPAESEQLDYEGEIAMIIGRGGRRIPREQAREHIAGLTLMNEGTIRDWTRHGKFNVTQGKNFVASGAIGPWMVPLDECPPLDRIKLTTRINGELRQAGDTDNLMFSFEYLVSYLSTFMQLQPGDVISTGTPTGAGIHADPPRFLVPDDVVEVSADGLGTLRNVVADE